MTPAAFKTKWAKFSGKESAAYQDHFSDLCRMLGVTTPIESDPTGSDTFCFQKHVAKDAELFDFDTTGNVEPASKQSGFADVWKKECFGWEYKGPGEDLAVRRSARGQARFPRSATPSRNALVPQFHCASGRAARLRRNGVAQTRA